MSSIRTRLRRRLSTAHKEQGGYSLVELLVSMGIFSLLMALVMSALVIMYQDTNRVQTVGNASDALRKTFQTLDRQVRYSDAVNFSGRVGDNYYVEFRQPNERGTAATCVQWRYTVSTGVLAWRSWGQGATPSATFMTIATNLQTGITTSPFTMQQATTSTVSTAVTYRHQRLAVNLNGARGDGTGDQLSSTFVATNSSVDSLGNKDQTTTGVSSSPVCSPSTTRV